ncbi:hypothetical protein [Deinococcus gobiensis]|uniref:Lipoprotein n=1 Tax=Deinococcus gobiensis (strain DSM 21396 / JCM 16679 / CGMCC 1.7299 / I-0) TaxID=745776 RepID=H8GXA4_DEIGI|nr:hypothetical protein [Deinococcus gobiensis]AFD25833.1 hypothetical protein DGo_CA1906 [Deinococcus gobiensis I-0]
MKKVLLLSTLSLALAACGTAPTPAPTPPAVVTPEPTPAGLVLTTEPAQLQAAGLSVTLTDRGLAVRPTGVEAVFRVYLDAQDRFGVPGEAAQRITGTYYVGTTAPLTIQGRTPFGWVDVARLR